MTMTANGIPVLLGPPGTFPRDGLAIVASPEAPVGAVLAVAEAIGDA